MMRSTCRVAALIVVLGAGSAAWAGGIEMGRWLAVLTVPGGDLPFAIELARDHGRQVAYYLNGAERVRVDEVSIRGDSLELAIPSFNSKIEAVLAGGRLTGTLRLVKRGGAIQVVPFRAERGARYRFSRDPPGGDVGGRWAVTFTDDGGASTVAVGEFRQEGARLVGTFRTPTGDYRFLEGQVQGPDLYLACFDGAHAFLFKASLGDDGKLYGDFWSGTAWHERWVATRDDRASLPDALKLTYLKPGHAFSFRFPDLDGSPVSLSDDAFRGRVVVVTLAGSWCPNCHDEAAFLARYYAENRDRGVEVIALMFEHFKDFETAAAQVAHFRRRHNIEYSTLVAGYSDKAEAAARLPMLSGVLAFPTTIVVGRRGEVRRISTGFDGPATGEHFLAYEKEFTQFLDELLGE
ncbi:MAG: TlpA disulfide reductase family protein [Candidatus Krumholzibacteriia bacterium]